MKANSLFLEKISSKQKSNHTKNKTKHEKKLECNLNPDDTALITKANIPLNELINDHVSDNDYHPDERVLASSPADEALNPVTASQEEDIPPEDSDFDFALPWYAFFAPIIGIALVLLSGSSNDDDDSDPKDTAAPTPAKITSQATSNDLTPEIKGSGEPGSTVTVAFLATGETVTGVVSTSGSWTVTATTPLPIGGNQFSVTITDPAGNSSPATDGKITIDLVAPTAPAITSPAGSNDTTPTITGTGEPGATANVIFPATGEIVTGIVNSAGSWSITPLQPLPIGNNQFTVTITDPGGNTSPSTGAQVFIDPTPPTAPIVTSPTGTNDPTPTISGTGEPGATASVVFQTGETATGVANSSGKWTVTPTQPLTPGANQFTVTITDPGGNTSPTTGGQMVIDILEPTAPAITSPTGTSDPTPTIKGTGEPGATATVVFPTGETVTDVVDSTGGWEVTPTEPLITGNNKFTVTITDPGGNSSTPTGGQLIVDPNPPTAPTITSPTGTSDPTPTIKGTGEPGATATVVFPTGETVTDVVDSTGGWEVTPTEPLITGNNKFTVTITDPGGNSSTPTGGQLIVDPNPPTAPTITSPTGTSDLTPTIAGTGEPGSTATVVFPTGETATSVINSAGKWEVTPTQPLVPGTSQITVTITDPGGNSSTPTGGQLIVDPNPPTAPTITSPTGTSDPTPTIKGTGEPGATATVVFPTGETVTDVVDSTGGWEVTPTEPLITGNNKFTVTITDPGGNSSTPTGGQLIVDPNPPTAPVITSPTGTSDPTPTIKGTGEPGATATVVFPTGETVTDVVDSTGGWEVTPTEPLITGNNKFTVTITDPGGNSSTPTGGQLIVDPNPPTAPTITSPTGTSDLTPTIAGTGEPGSTATVVFPTGETATSVINSAGKWEVTPTQPLVPGTSQITVTITDPGGNSSTPTGGQLIVDPNPPTAPTITSPTGTSDPTPTIKGTGEPGATATVVFPTGETVTDVVDSTGGWEVTPTEPLITGNNKFTVTITDPGGNSSTPTGGQLIVDPNPPTAPVITSPTGTSDPTPTIKGTGEPGATATVVFPTGETVTDVVDSTGGWEVTPTEPLITGNNKFTVTITDPGGNSSTPTGGQLIVDPNPPTAPTITSPTGTSDPTPTIKGTGEPGATATVVFPTGETVTDVVDSTGGWEVTPTEPLITGNNKFTVTITDPGGNSSTPTGGQLIVDPNPPTAPVITSPTGTSDLTPTIAGTGEPGSTATVVFPTGETATSVINSAGKWEVTPTQPLVPGTSQITVTITDPGGNSSTPTGGQLIVDPNPPTAPTITSPTGTSDPTPTIKGTGEPGATATVVFPTGETVTDVVDSTGGWEVTPTEPLITGNNKFTVTITDPGGNSSTPTGGQLIVDPNPPTAPTITSPTGTSDLTPTIAGTGEPGSTATVVFPTGETATSVINSTGKWEVTPTQPLVPGTSQITVTVTDPGGNSSTPTGGQLIVDPNPPTAPTITSPTGTSDLTPTIAGTGEPGSTATVVFPTGETATSVINSTGKWEVTPTQPLVPGTSQITVTVTDPGGNSSTPTGGQLIVDPNPPTAPTITSPTGTSDLTPTIAGTGEPGSTATVVFPTGETATSVINSTGKWEVTPTQPLVPGTSQITVTVTDPGGNSSTPTGGQLIVDPNPPTAPVITSPTGTSDPTPTIKGTGEPGATATVVFPTGETVTDVVDSTGGWEVTPTEPLITGNNKFTVTITDPGGNSSTPTGGQLIVDPNPPTAPTITSPTGTSDLTPTIAGTGEPGSTATVVFPTGETATSVINSIGKWEVTPTQPLVPGTSQITVTVTDPGGNSSTPTGGQLIVDPNPPTAPTITSPTGTSDLTPTIAGTGEPGSTATVVFPTGETATSVINSTGKWEVTPTQPLVPGTSQITVTVTDPGGNSSTPTGGQLIVDPNPPTAPTITSPTGTSDLTPTIAGTGEPGSTATVVFPTGETVTSVINSTGKWEVTPTQPLVPGTSQITVTVTDPGGNSSTPTSGQLIVDLTAPTSPTIDPITDVKTTTPTITGTAEPGSVVKVTSPTGEVLTSVVGSDGKWEVTPTQPLPPGGPQTISVMVTDPAGNTSPITTAPVTVDLTAPTAPTIDPITDVKTTTPTITGTAEPGSVVKVTSPTGEVLTSVVGSDGKWEVTPTQPLPPGGPQTISVMVTDPAGNTSPITTAPVTVDLTAPTSPTIDPITDVKTTTPTITGTAEPGSVVKVTSPTGEVLTSVVGSDGKWEVTPTQPLPPGGPQTISVMVTDPAGNTSPITTAPVTVDLTAPTSPTIDPITDVKTTTPTITGTAEPGSVVKVTSPTGEVLTSVVGSDGKWEVTPTQPLPPRGPQTISVMVTDPAGNTSPITTAPVTVDLTAPTSPTIDPITDVKTTTPTITGTAEPGSVVKVTSPTGEVLTSVVGSDGKWEVTPTQPLPPGGPQTISVMVTDPAGNTSPITTAPVTVDLTAPTAPTIDPITDVKTTTPTITGTAEPGSVVKVTSPTGEVLTSVVGSDGKWEVTPTQPLPPGGPQTISVMVTDPAGNTSPITTAPVTVDLTAPTAPTIDPITDVKTTTPTITGTAEPGSVVKVTSPTGEVLTSVVGSDGKWEVTPTQPLPPGGPQTISVMVTDPAGNTSPITTAPVTVDLTAPTAPTIDPITDVKTTTPTITGTAEPGSVVKVTSPTGEVLTSVVGSDGKWEVTPTQPLPPGGPQTISVMVTDPAGNTSPITTAPVTVDLTAPTSPTIDPITDVKTTTPTITGTAEPGSVVKVTSPTGEVLTSVVGSDGKWEVTPTQPLPPGGPQTISVMVTDPAGNTSPITTAPVTVDLTAPTAPTIDPITDVKTTTPTITGTAEPGSVVKVTSPTGEVLTSVVGSDGKWEVTPTQPLPPGGPQTISVMVTDPAGNTSPITTAPVTVDLTAPTAPTIDPITDVKTTTPTITGTAEPGSVVKVTSPTGEVLTSVVGSDGKWEVTPTQPLPPGGPQTISVMVTDPAGNTSPITTAPVTVDLTAPTAPTIDPITDVKTTTPTITGTAEPGSVVKVTSPTGEVLTSVVGSDGKWEVTPTQPLPPGGPQTISVMVTDPAGNTSPITTAPVTVDLTDPSVPTVDFIGAVNENTPVITGSAEAGSTVEVTTPAGEKLTALVDSSGHWTVTPTQTITQGGPQTISVISTDKAGNSSSGASNDLIVIINDAPTATDATISIAEDSVKTFTAADFGFADSLDTPANALKNVIITSLPAAGSLTMNGDAVTVGQAVSAADLANLTYAPAAGASGSAYASFGFKVQDNGGVVDGGVDMSAAANTMTIDVTSVNDAPTGTDKTLTVLEDQPLGFTAADFGFADAMDAPTNILMTIIVTTLPATGTLALNGTPVAAGQSIAVADLGGLLFTPALNTNGAANASFGFKVQDNGGVVDGGVDMSTTANTMTIDVTSVNDAPTGTDKTLTVLEDQPLGFTAADFGFADAMDAPTNILMTIIVTTLPATGTLALNGTPVAAGQSIAVADLGGLLFTPALNTNGAANASFGFKVQDNGGVVDGGVDLSTTANTMTIDVTSVNDAPTGTDKTLTVLEDQPLGFTAADFGFADAMDAPTNILMTIIVTTLPATGTLALNGTPVAAGQSIAVADLGGLLFTPALNTNGAANASFGFKVQDNGGVVDGGVDMSAAANTMTIDVTSVNDAPTGTDKTLTVLEDQPLGFTAADFGFADAMDAPTNILMTIIVTTLPVTGTLALNGTPVTAGQSIAVADLGGLLFTPALNTNGAANASFGFKVQDNGGVVDGGVDMSAAANTMTIDVTSVNDAPTGTDKTLTVLEDQPLGFTAADFGFADAMDAPTNILMTIIVTTLPVTGTLALNGTPVTAGQSIAVADLGGLLFTPALNTNGAANASFGFKVQDNGGVVDGGVDMSAAANTMTIDVTSVNDAPTGTDKTLTVLEDQPLGFTAADFGFADAMDAPANALMTIIITTLPALGTLTIGGSAVAAGATISAANLANLVYTPPANANGNAYANFGFKVQDNGGTASGGVNTAAAANTMTFNVTSVNDAPTGTNKTITVLEDGSKNDFAAADFGLIDSSDSPANTLSNIIIMTVPALGALTLNGAAVTVGQPISAADLANLAYTPPVNANGNAYANFSFKVQDDGGTAASGIDTALAANTITFNVTPINDAPVVGVTTGTHNSNLVLSMGSAAKVALNGINPTNTTNAVPSGWTLIANGVEIYGDSPADGVLSDTGQAMTNVNGTSKNGGTAEVLTARDGTFYTGIYTQLTGLTVGTTYSIAVEWQQATGFIWSGGQLAISKGTVASPATGVVTGASLGKDPVIYTSSGLSDTWQTAEYAFVATAATQNINVQINSMTGGVGSGGDSMILVDSLSIADYTASNVLGQGSGATAFDIFNDSGNPTDIGVASTSPASSGYVSGSVSDIDQTSQLKGWAITSAAATGSNHWEYFNGSSWVALTAASESAAIFVKNTDLIRWNGTDDLYTNLSAVAVDDTSLASYYSTINVTTRGTSTAYSTDIVTLNPRANNPPTGQSKTVAINEDAAFIFSANDFGFADPSNSPSHLLSNVIITSLPSAGALTLGGAAVTLNQTIPAASLSTLVYTPAANTNGNSYASVGFKVQDSGGGADTSLISNLITFNVTPVNDAPQNRYNGTAITPTTPINFVPIAAGGLMDIAGLTVYDADDDTGVTQPLTPAGNGLDGGTGGSVVYTMYGPNGVLDDGSLKLKGITGSVSGTKTTYVVGTATSVFDSSTSALTITGTTLADINLAISKMQYQDNAASVGDVQMHIVSTDRTGLFDADPVKISLPINDNQFLTNGNDGSLAMPIVSGAGRDVVFGKSGADVIDGGSDADVVFGGFGSGVRNYQFDYWNIPPTGTGTNTLIVGGVAFDYTQFAPLPNNQIGWKSTGYIEYLGASNPDKRSPVGNGFYSLDGAANPNQPILLSQNIFTAAGEAYTASLTLAIGPTHSGITVGWNGVNVLTFTGAQGAYATASGITVSRSALIYSVSSSAGLLSYYTYTISGLVGAAGANNTALSLKSNGTDGTTTVITQLTVDPANSDSADTLAGGSGADYVWGQGGDDILYGGSLNSSKLNTDAAVDTFAFDMRKNEGADVIKDFVVGIDQIYLVNFLDNNTSGSKYPSQRGTDNGGSLTTATLSSDNNLNAADFTGTQSITLSDGGTGLKLTFGNSTSIVLEGVAYEATAVANNSAYGSVAELLGTGETKAIYVTGDSIPKGFDTII